MTRRQRPGFEQVGYDKRRSGIMRKREAGHHAPGVDDVGDQHILWDD
jgi:hypothetical protein